MCALISMQAACAPIYGGAHASKHTSLLPPSRIYCAFVSQVLALRL